MNKNRIILGLAVLIWLCCVPVFAEEKDSTSPESESEELVFEGFLNDLVSALNIRCDAVDQVENTSDVSVEEEKGISNITVEEREKEKAITVAKAEWDLMARYKTARFVKPNEEYLRKEYMEGLEQQVGLEDDMSDVGFWDTWNEGYLRRVNVLEELISVYSTEYPRISEIRVEITSQLDELTGGFTESGTPEAYQIQALLIVQGMGMDMDGQPGKNTITALKQKQKELGIPMNGVINKKRVEELVKALEENEWQYRIDEANQLLKRNGYSEIDRIEILRETEDFFQEITEMETDSEVTV